MTDTHEYTLYCYVYLQRKWSAISDTPVKGITFHKCLHINVDFATRNTVHSKLTGDVRRAIVLWHTDHCVSC